MGFLVLLVLIGLPVLEIWLMIEVGEDIGALPTVALIVGTAALGTLLFRIQGVATLGRVQEHINRGETPVGELLSGLGLLAAGFLLLIPGFLTDAIGLVLFIPPARRLLIGAVIAWAIAHGTTRIWTVRGQRPPPGGPGPQGPGPRGPGDRPSGGRGPVIDGEFQDVTDRDPRSEPSDPERLEDGEKR